MSEMLVRFDEPISAPDGRKYFAHAIGRETASGIWEGWLEFVTDDDSPTLSSERETTQPNRRSVDYWAQGLTRVYLEGALARASSKANRLADGVFESAGHPRRSAPPRQDSRGIGATANARPILNPFAVYAQGEHILRSELRALSREQVETIATAYGLAGPDATKLSSRNSGELVDALVEGVRAAEAR